MHPDGGTCLIPDGETGVGGRDGCVREGPGRMLHTLTGILVASRIQTNYLCFVRTL